jgi:hypothetical protein
MIGGAVHGTGGPALGRHLVKQAPGEESRPGSSRGLLAEGIEEQTQELTGLAAASGHKTPLRHVYASPPAGASWSEETWSRYWETYERAMGLQGCPYSEAIHDKPGDHGRPEHRHRLYLALTERGTLVRVGWDYARQESVSRIIEFDTGAALNRGKHNVRAARVAESLGRVDVAAAMSKAGLLEGPRASASVTPRERAQAERTGVDPRAVGAAALAAWRTSDIGVAFKVALEERGLRLALGDKTVVLVDQTGACHALARVLGRESKAQGEDRIPASAVAERVATLVLPPRHEVSRQQGVEAVVPVSDQATMKPPAAPAQAEARPPRSMPSVEAVSAPQFVIDSEGPGQGIQGDSWAAIAAFFAREAAAQERQNKRLAALQRSGGSYVSTNSTTAPSSAVGNRGFPGNFGGGQLPGPQDPGPRRVVASGVGRPGGGHESRQPPSTSGSSRTEGRGTVADQSHSQPIGGDRRSADADRAAAGRRRAETGRARLSLERACTSEWIRKFSDLTAALRYGMTVSDLRRERRIAVALRAAEDRAQQVPTTETEAIGFRR